MDLNATTFKCRIKGDNLRHGFVGVTTDGERLYGAVNGSVLHIPVGKHLKHLYLVVMGAPRHHEDVLATEANHPEEFNYRQFPYAFKIWN